MVKEMKRRKDIFLGFLRFRREMGKKQELGVKEVGDPRFQSRRLINLVYMLRSVFKCVEIREI